MAVNWIKQRAIEQANSVVPTPATPASTSNQTATAASAAEEFAAALRQAGLSISPVLNKPSAAGIIATRERPEEAPRAEKPAPKQERSDTRRNDDKRPVEKAAKEDSAPAPKSTPQASSDEGKGDEAVQVDVKNTNADASTEVVVQANVATPQEAVAVVIQAPQEQLVQQTAQVQVQTTEPGANTQAQVGTGPVQQTTDTTGQKQATIDPRAAQNAAKDETVVDPQVLQAAAKAVKQASGGDKQNLEETPDLLQTQAQDLAAKLSATGARVNVQVQETRQATAPTSTTLSSGEAVLAQDVSAVTPVAGQQTGAGQAGSQDRNAAGTLAQQTATLTANGPATTGAEVAGSFAASMTTQTQGTTNTQTTSQGPQQVVGLGNAEGASSAQKASTPQAPQAPRQPSKASQQEVVDQITVQIARQVKGGNDTIKITLKPVELGTIEVKLEVAPDGRVTAIVTADNKDTLALLQKDTRGLEKALNDAGLNTDSSSLSFNLRGEGQQTAGQQSQGQGTQARRSRIAAAAAIDAANAQAAAAAQARWTGSGSVNIKV